MVRELTPETAYSPETEEQAAQPLEDWLAANYPDVVSAAPAPRHERTWDWIEDLEPGVKPEALIEIWPRGSGKSTTIELGVVRAGVKLTRRFALYICNTQEQADLHVAAIADHFEDIGVQRALNVYGSSKGWRRNQLRTANGFNVAGLGLDVAMRGIKMGRFRPDLLIFDDVDDVADSPKTVSKKLITIPSKILAAGSVDAAVAFIQNLVHEDSVASQLVSGKAQFLMDRRVSPVEVAVQGLEVKLVDRGDGVNVWRIVGGEATWPGGQPLSVCERQISEWGLDTFLREAQQEVEGAGGYFFDHEAFEDFMALPLDLSGWKFCRAWDIAGTEGGGDYTVGVLLGRTPQGLFYVIDVVRGQWSPDNVEKALVRTAKADAERFGPRVVKLRLPQDPAQAGKYQVHQLQKLLAGENIVIKPVSGTKASRAKGWAGKVNIGNVRIPKNAPWRHAFKEEHRKFREDEEHEFDDQVDAASDAYNEIGETKTWDAL